MMFYTFELDDESKEICTINTPFGHYQYQKLTMGCSQSPDVAQEIMESMLADIDNTEIYINDVGVFSKTWEHHLKALEVILTRLQENNFIINPLKCEWAVEQAEFLGHWMTPIGIKPIQKKVDAMINMAPPRNVTKV
jgi:Reverse transcriptase (RNA-dependent DNA polymerase)